MRGHHAQWHPGLTVDIASAELIAAITNRQSGWVMCVVLERHQDPTRLATAQHQGLILR